MPGVLAVAARGRHLRERAVPQAGSPRIGRIHAIGYRSGALRRVMNSYKYRENMRSWSVILGRLLLAWLEENLAG